MNHLLGIVALSGLILSAVVHVAAVAGMDVSQRVPAVWLLHMGILVVFVPFVFSCRRLPLSQGGIGVLLAKLPSWLTMLGTGFLFYAFINFLVFMAATEGGNPSIEGGRFVLSDHGRLIREITGSEYQAFRANEARGASGHWMAFYFLPFAGFMYLFRKKPDQVPAPTGIAVGRPIAWGGVIALIAGFSPPIAKQFFQPEIAGPRIQHVTVEEGVKLQVVDWGGSGRPLVLIPGLGMTARAFDEFATKLTHANHVYGITRRGFGNSSRPASGYSADRLGDDLLAVLDALKLERPVLVGHSAGGSELSSIASRHPDRVAGIVYLEAGYGYAYHCPESPPPFAIDPKWPVPVKGVLGGFQRYTQIPVPALAIYAIPTDQSWRSKDPAIIAKFEAEEVARNLPQARAFEKGVPTSRVVIIPKASHWVWYSHEAEVLREMEAFLRGLK